MSENRIDDENQEMPEPDQDQDQIQSSDQSLSQEAGQAPSQDAQAQDSFEEETPAEEEQSFAEMLDAYSAGMQDNLQIGDKIDARVISIGKDAIYMDTGTKVDGAVDRSELLDDEGNFSLVEGDSVELFVVAMDEHEIRLSKAISAIGGIEILHDAFENAIPVEGTVAGTCKGGFNVTMVQRRAFCPISQIDVNYVETPEDYVGQTHEFLITQFEERGKNIVVSRRKLLAKAIEAAKKEFFGTLQKGDTVEGRITKLMPYGAFVELIPGVEGMIHISELSWSRVEKSEEAVQSGETVTVKVLDIGEGAKPGQKKIALSIKQVDANPWETVTDKFKPGQKVSGKVTRCMKFGVFVEIAPGIEGLVHISEMSYVKRIINPEDVVSPGEAVSVLIKDLDPKARRISLSMRDAAGDPWLEVTDKFSVGQVTTGTVEKKEKFGLFITLSAGITGLMPKSKFRAAEKPADLEKLKAGDTVTVVVAEIHPQDRKITLAPGDVKDEGDWQDFAPAKAAAAPMSDLAAKLQQAMAKKGRK